MSAREALARVPEQRDDMLAELGALKDVFHQYAQIRGDPMSQTHKPLPEAVVDVLTELYNDRPYWEIGVPPTADAATLSHLTLLSYLTHCFLLHIGWTDVQDATSSDVSEDEMRVTYE